MNITWIFVKGWTESAAGDGLIDLNAATTSVVLVQKHLVSNQWWYLSATGYGSLLAITTRVWLLSEIAPEWFSERDEQTNDQVTRESRNNNPSVVIARDSRVVLWKEWTKNDWATHEYECVHNNKPRVWYLSETVDWFSKRRDELSPGVVLWKERMIDDRATHECERFPHLAVVQMISR